MRLDHPYPVTDTNHTCQHALIVRLPSPCLLNRDDLSKQSCRFIIELDPVLDPPHPAVRPISIPACLTCHDASLSCAQFVRTVLGRWRNTLAPVAPHLRQRKHRPVVIKVKILSINSVLKQQWCI